MANPEAKIGTYKETYEMSKLYKRTRILVSRFYCHGGDGLEDLGLRFFRSQEEYDEEAEKHGWTTNGGDSFKSSWCTTPVEMEALISQRDLARFKEGQPLTMDKVFFASTLAAQVHRIGGWQV